MTKFGKDLVESLGQALEMSKDMKAYALPAYPDPMSAGLDQYAHGYIQACEDVINIVDDASDQISLDVSSQIKKRIQGLIMKERGK